MLDVDTLARAGWALAGTAVVVLALAMLGIAIHGAVASLRKGKRS